MRLLTTCGVLGLAAVGCSADTGELRRVSFAVDVGGVARDPERPLTLQTMLGWDVTLDAAELSVAAIYFRNAPPSAGTSDQPGRVTAQVLGPFTIDALAPEPQRLEISGSGLSERAASAELVLTEAEDGPVADAQGPLAALAHLAGVARRDDQEISFDGGLQLPLLAETRAYDSWQRRRIGALTADFIPTQDSTLTVRVDPSAFLNAIQFDALGPANGLRDFETDAEQLQLRNGIASVRSYDFSLEP